VADVKEREELRREELLKLYFEFFKHFTTLSVAAVVVLLAVYREVAAERLRLLLSLGHFGVAVILAVFGIAAAMSHFRMGKEAGQLNLVLARLVAVFFGGGLSSFILPVLGVPIYLYWLPVAVSLVGYIFYLHRASSH
jgi:hypothetical protein